MEPVKQHGQESAKYVTRRAFCGSAEPHKQPHSEPSHQLSLFHRQIDAWAEHVEESCLGLNVIHIFWNLSRCGASFL